MDVINGSPLTAIANLYISLNCHARSWLLLYKYVEGRVVKCEMKCSVTFHNDIPAMPENRLYCHARQIDGKYDTKWYDNCLISLLLSLWIRMDLFICSKNHRPIWQWLHKTLLPNPNNVILSDCHTISFTGMSDNRLTDILLDCHAR